MQLIGVMAICLSPKSADEWVDVNLWCCWYFYQWPTQAKIPKVLPTALCGEPNLSSWSLSLPVPTTHRHRSPLPSSHDFFCPQILDCPAWNTLLSLMPHLSSLSLVVTSRRSFPWLLPPKTRPFFHPWISFPGVPKTCHPTVITLTATL
jgi:hypothetical protein